MRVHVIEHVDFEGPGLIAEWAAERGHQLTGALALSEEFPPLEDVDLLVLMGGPMGAGETDRYPWLAAERRYVQKAIAVTRVLGVCLGAQIIAAVAGGSVYRADHQEIGWYPLRTSESSWKDPVFGRVPDGLIAGHWHSDTFSLPGVEMPVLSSDACPNQAFTLNGGRVAGMQFHLEWTHEGLRELLSRCADEIALPGPWVVEAAEMLPQYFEHMPACRRALYGVLDAMAGLSRRETE